MDGWSIVFATAIVGGIGWLIKHSVESAQREREAAKAERRRVYMKVLVPVLKSMHGTRSDSQLNQAQLEREILSYKYMEALVELKLIASDAVAVALGKLFQVGRTGSLGPHEMVETFGGLLLAIRKDLGNRSTRLRERDMLDVIIKDLDQVLPPGNKK